MCCKRTRVSELITKLGCFIPICNNKSSNCKNVMPFELEELMGDKEYATIVRSPKVVRESHYGGTHKPIATPKVSFKIPTAPTEDSIQIPANSISDYL